MEIRKQSESNGSRPRETVYVGKTDEWRTALKLLLMHGDDVGIVGLNCDTDEQWCQQLAEKHGYWFDCHRGGKHAEDYARLSNKKFHDRPPSPHIAFPEAPAATRGRWD